MIPMYVHGLGRLTDATRASKFAGREAVLIFTNILLKFILHCARDGTLGDVYPGGYCFVWNVIVSEFTEQGPMFHSEFRGKPY